jgi:phage terminase small subunit
MADKAQKTADIVVINTQHLRLKPPAYLKPEAKAVFEEVVNATAPSHFTRAEAPVLGLYCNAIHLARHYASKIGTDGDAGQNHKWWVENTRLACSLATKLRLTPSSRFDGRASEKKSHEPTFDAEDAPWDD